METTTNSNASREDYEVGFKKPPKEAQFPKGKSGNPKGRPRKAKNALNEMLTERLNEMVTVPGTKRTRIPRCQLLIGNLVNSAVKGDAKALLNIIRMMEDEDGEPAPTEPYWMVFRYHEALAAQGPEHYNDEFYKQQEENIAQWKKELRSGLTTMKGMLERELSRKVMLAGDNPRKVAKREIIVARFMKEAADNPSMLKLLFKLMPKKKFKRDYSRIEILRPTEKELERCPAPGMTWEEWELKKAN